jgi:hypothetical protein
VSTISRATAEAVRRRANFACEYCGLREAEAELRHQIDHVVARQHALDDRIENLALACGFCNSHKGPNLSGIDPETGAITTLFNPRTDEWTDHFRRAGVEIVGLTATGRATITVLAMNAREQLQRRGAVG